MTRSTWLISMTAIVAIAGMACIGNPDLPGTGDDTTAAAVAAKAINVANTIGGAQGYGGTLMDGYGDHMPGQMGFLDDEDLADPDLDMRVRFRNDSDEDCTFHLTYFANHMGLDEHTEDVEVPAGEEGTFDFPCAEIVGVGSLEMPGEPGCQLADGETVDNVMAVPAFLGTDYVCGGFHEFHLTPDVDDLDGDGDTDELIIVSDAMQDHMGSGGPMGHDHHGGGGGMMMGGLFGQQ